MNPVIAMLLGVWIANEAVTRFEWYAVAVVLAGVLLLLFKRPGRRHAARVAASSHMPAAQPRLSALRPRCESQRTACVPADA